MYQYTIQINLCGLMTVFDLNGLRSGFNALLSLLRSFNLMELDADTRRVGHKSWVR